jgi:excisionase family DNA binding protein
MRAELQSVLDSLKEMPADRLPDLMGELEVIRATALLRISSAMPSTQTRDELITVEQAAERLGLSTDYLYRHSKQLPFTRRVGRKLMFSSLRIDAYIRQNRGR